MAWLTITIEVLGGVAVLLGAFVPLVSVPMAAVLLVAVFTIHLPYGFSSINLVAVTSAGAVFGPPGYETDLLYLACLAALVAGGSGPLAIGGDIANPRSGPGAAGPGLASAIQSTPGVASAASPSLQAVISPGQDVRGARMLSIMAQARQRFS
jgi:hypothetical protein